MWISKRTLYCLWSGVELFGPLAILSSARGIERERSSLNSSNFVTAK